MSVFFEVRVEKRLETTCFFCFYFRPNVRSYAEIL